MGKVAGGCAARPVGVPTWYGHVCQHKHLLDQSQVSNNGAISGLLRVQMSSEYIQKPGRYTRTRPTLEVRLRSSICNARFHHHGTLIWKKGQPSKDKAYPLGSAIAQHAQQFEAHRHIGPLVGPLALLPTPHLFLLVVTRPWVGAPMPALAYQVGQKCWSCSLFSIASTAELDQFLNMAIAPGVGSIT